MLAYFVDPHSSALHEELEHLRSEREHRAEAIVSCAARGRHSDHDGRRARTLGRRRRGPKPHRSSARELRARRHDRRTRSSATSAEDGPSTSPSDSHIARRGHIAWCGRSAPSRCWRIPGVTRADALIPAMIDSGLLGIEAYHADHTPEQRARYARMADDLGLARDGRHRLPRPAGATIPSSAASTCLRHQCGRSCGSTRAAPEARRPSALS